MNGYSATRSLVESIFGIGVLALHFDLRLAGAWVTSLAVYPSASSVDCTSSKIAGESGAVEAVAAKPVMLRQSASLLLSSREMRSAATYTGA